MSFDEIFDLTASCWSVFSFFIIYISYQKQIVHERCEHACARRATMIYRVYTTFVAPEGTFSSEFDGGRH